MTDNPRTGLWFDSAADAARAANVSPSTITAAISDGRIPDAYLSSDGWWRVPVEGMRAAGWNVTGEGAHLIGPLDRQLPDPLEVDGDRAYWSIIVSAVPGKVIIGEDRNPPRGVKPWAAREIAYDILAAALWADTRGQIDG